MIDPARDALGPGDRAPGFALPAADGDGTVRLADYLARGPVLLALITGLYCPFCRRQFSFLKRSRETLFDRGVTLLGIVIGSTQRTHQYFRHFPVGFPVAASPDRAVHRAYGLPEMVRTPEYREQHERRAAAVVEELGLQAPPGQAAAVFAGADGFEMTPEDNDEWQRPLQACGQFLIGRDGVIRWARAEWSATALPQTDELVSLL